jgi:hypothetical protein
VEEEEGPLGVEKLMSSFDESRSDCDDQYALKEFGSLQLNYDPYETKIFSAGNGHTYVLLILPWSLIVFTIEPIV